MRVDPSAAAPCDAWIPRNIESRHVWLAFNRLLDRDAAGFYEEKTLARRVAMVQAQDPADPPIFWLTVARLTELALKLAGDYADACEFQAAGDLLANPREIDVYVRGENEPIRKRRHGALSERFAAAIGDANPVNWLSRHTLPYIRRTALLPQLSRMLAASGVMATEYIAAINQRMCRIADAITFLAAWRIGEIRDLRDRLEFADDADRELTTAHLCRFSLHRFVALGDDINRWILDGDRTCQFLRPTADRIPRNRV